MKKTIYISGAISGREAEAEKQFNIAENILKACGYEVVNPMKLNHDHDLSWSQYMRVDIKALMDCDCIYMLEGWDDSRGAKLESEIAKELRIDFIFDTLTGNCLKRETI